TERSITLAEAMDSRGYGRAATRRPSRLRPRSWTRNDRIAAVVSIVAVLAAVLITSIDGSVTNTSTLMPTAPLAGLVLATSLAIPAFLGGDR
ncbi:MAG TPA: hypothetical protein VNA87_04265, partial [Actinomycetota bacterium]|nr:hypothetical protein [Actinomycetota bacterium]